MKMMTGGLMALAEAIEKIESTKDDMIVPAKTLEMGSDDRSLTVHAKGKSYDLNTIAHQQLSSKLNIPKKYYDRMIEIPGLRSQNVNAWLSKQKDDAHYLVRTVEDKARAFLSDSFKPIDNAFILHGFLPLVQDMQLIVKACQLTERKMFVQVLFPKIADEVSVGDVVQFGISLSNSEVGCGSVNVRSFLHRLSCTNGMVGESLIRKYHSGLRVGEFVEDYNIYSSETIQKELESFQGRLGDIFKHVIAEGYFNTQMLKLKRSLGFEVENVSETVENVTRRFCYPEEFKDKMLMNIGAEAKGKVNRWNIANSITALVHDIEDADKAYQIEKDGYEIIDMSDKEWKTLVS